jgi:hypothetical protein
LHEIKKTLPLLLQKKQRDEKDISAIDQEKKKQTRFQREDVFCQWQESAGAPQGTVQEKADSVG